MLDEDLKCKMDEVHNMPMTSGSLPATYHPMSKKVLDNGPRQAG